MRRILLLTWLVCGMGCMEETQAQGWAVVDEKSVEVKAGADDGFKLLGTAKRGDVLDLREKSADEDYAYVWFKGRSGRILRESVSLFRPSGFFPGTLTRTYDMLASCGTGEKRGRMDFVVLDSLLLMRLRWADGKKDTEYYLMDTDSLGVRANRAFVGELPSGRNVFLNTSKTLQFARVFHYDKTRRAFFDGDAFYFAEDTTAARKDLALFDPVWERHKSLGKQRKEMKPDKEAMFPGGLKKCVAFLSGNLKYPPACAKEKIQGRVFVQFVVEKDGSIGQIRTLRSPHPYLSLEAMRVVGKMPDWQPAVKGGKPVRCLFVLPVNFTLDRRARK